MGVQTYRLVLAQRRPWENNADKDAKTFKLRLKVN
jgi:hypothetical protein